MLRELKIQDIEEANLLLSEFNYHIKKEFFNNIFFKSLIYYDDGIKGILVYDLLYDRIEIEYIIVDTQYRKRGIGTLLLNEIEQKGIKNITLEVRESNKAAIEFYKKNGYSIETIRKNYYGSENGYLMLKELGE